MFFQQAVACTLNVLCEGPELRPGVACWSGLLHRTSELFLVGVELWLMGFGLADGCSCYLQPLA